MESRALFFKCKTVGNIPEISGIPEIVLDIPGENCPIGEKEKKYGVNSAQSPILTGNCFIESDHYLKLQKIC